MQSLIITIWLCREFHNFTWFINLHGKHTSIQRHKWLSINLNSRILLQLIVLYQINWKECQYQLKYIINWINSTTMHNAHQPFGSKFGWSNCSIIILSFGWFIWYARELENCALYARYARYSILMLFKMHSIPIKLDNSRIIIVIPWPKPKLRFNSLSKTENNCLFNPLRPHKQFL